MVGLVVRAPAPPAAETGISQGNGSAWFTWENDTVMREASGRYEIRISATATAVMHAEARNSAASRGSDVETGGLLLGAFDDAIRVVWIDDATGPPQDSERSRISFIHGIENVDGFLAERRRATARVSQFLGMWHTHPNGIAFPSATDEVGMVTLLAPRTRAPRRALLLIVGGEEARWSGWLEEEGMPDWYARVIERTQVPGPA